MLIRSLIEHGVVVLDDSAGLVHPKNWDEKTRAASEDASLAWLVVSSGQAAVEKRESSSSDVDG
jgi:hypothetical protein